MDKKSRERKFVKEAALLLADFPQGEMCDCESPDFLIPQHDKTIGIELAEYYHDPSDEGGSVEFRNQKLHREIIKTACERCITPHNEGLLVTLHWSPRAKLKDSQIDHLAEELVSVVVSNIPTELAEQRELDYRYLRNTPLHGIVRLISIYRWDKRTSWTRVESGWGDVIPAEVQKLVRLKDAKVKAYRKKCDEVWLLVVAAGENVAAMADIDDATSDIEVESNFNRVLYYDRVNKQVVELKNFSSTSVQ